MTGPLSAYASEIYLQGLGGVLPAFTTDSCALEDAARERMQPGPFWYVAGSAGSGATARANREAFDRVRLVPRMLTGATQRDLTTTVLGATLSAPVITAPIGVQSIVHPDAEQAAATVTAELGLAMALSMPKPTPAPCSTARIAVSLSLTMIGPSTATSNQRPSSKNSHA